MRSAFGRDPLPNSPMTHRGIGKFTVQLIEGRRGDAQVSDLSRFQIEATGSPKKPIASMTV